MKIKKIFCFFLFFIFAVIFAVGCMAPSKNQSFHQALNQSNGKLNSKFTAYDEQLKKNKKEKFKDQISKGETSSLLKEEKQKEKGEEGGKRAENVFPTFQSVSSYGKSSYRKYRKLTPEEMNKKLENSMGSYVERQKVEKESSPPSGHHSGSLWASDHQGAYLFSESTLKRVGDPIKVILDGNPRTQLLKKKEIIHKILMRRKKRLAYQNRTADLGIKNKENKKDLKESKTMRSKDESPETSERLTRSFQSFALESISSKIVQKLPRGYYKIKGFETILIGKRQYNILVTGVARPQDLVENKIQSSKLIDSYFDIVRYKKRARF